MNENNKKAFANNSRRIATPVLGFSPGKCYAAPITPRMIGASSFLPIYVCFSRAEALLMASNTSYLSVYRVASAFFTISMHCSSPVNVWLSLCPILGVRAAPCSVSISRSNLLWLVFVHQRFGLISAWLGPSNGLNVLAIRLMLYINLKSDCSGNRLSVSF
jgi:hypothetical protein